MHRVEHVCVKSSIHLYNYVACTFIIKIYMFKFMHRWYNNMQEWSIGMAKSACIHGPY